MLEFRAPFSSHPLLTQHSVNYSLGTSPFPLQPESLIQGMETLTKKWTRKECTDINITFLISQKSRRTDNDL